jgi:hypothetical protein
LIEATIASRNDFESAASKRVAASSGEIIVCHSLFALADRNERRNRKGPQFPIAPAERRKATIAETLIFWARNAHFRFIRAAAASSRHTSA